MIDALSHLRHSFAARLPAGTDVRIRPGACVALCRGGRCIPVHEPLFRTPLSGADCFAVRTSAQIVPFGLARLGVYSLPDFPGHTFDLGLSGEMRLSLAHLHGLRPLLLCADGPLTLRGLLALPQIEPALREALCTSVTGLCGGKWDYPLLKCSLPILTAAALPRLYDLLFAHGLLLHPRSFAIRSLSTPILDA